MITGGPDGLRVWDLERGELISGIRVTAPAAGALFPNGRHAVVSSLEHLLVLDLDGLKVARKLTGHTGWVKCVQIAADGTQIVSSGFDGTAMVWRLGASSRQMQPRRRGHPSTVTTGIALNTVAATGDYEGSLKLWDLQTGKLQAEHKCRMGKREYALSARAGRTVLTSSSDLEGGSILALNVADGSEEAIRSTAADIAFLGFDRDERHAFLAHGAGATVDVLAIRAPKGQTLALQYLRTLKAPRGRSWIEGAAVTSDGRLLVASASPAYGAGRCQLVLFDVGNGEILATSAEIDGSAQQLAIDNTGARVAFTTIGGRFGMWEPRRRSKVRVLATDLGGDPKLAALAGGTRVVTAGTDVRVWDLDRGEQVNRLTGHPGTWHLEVVKADQILTASDDWTISLWELAIGSEVATLALDRPARVATLNPDGRVFLCGDHGGDVYAFRIVRPATRGGLAEIRR